MIHVVGYKGNMGQRYCSILEYLNVKYIGTDVEDDAYPCNPKGRIIATPTDTHYSILKEFREYKGPILCEKPITKNKEELEEIKSWNLNLSIVNQYVYLYRGCSDSYGPTNYNYFKSGTDGLIWDCISIISLSNRRVLLKNESPVWSCEINGYEINIEEMDCAYIKMIDAWLDGLHEAPIWLPHLDILESIEGKNDRIKVFDRDSSEK